MTGSAAAAAAVDRPDLQGEPVTVAPPFVDEIPSRAELITQAVNGDMVRIIANAPPRALTIAHRLEILRRVMAWLTGLGFGAAVVLAFTSPEEVATIVLAVAVTCGLAYTAVWALTTRFVREARVDLFRKYGVAPNRDGAFEMVVSGEPHEDLAATREMLREYGAP